jgi:hypothetical protein
MRQQRTQREIKSSATWNPTASALPPAPGPPSGRRARHQARRARQHPQYRGKPFLTVSNAPTDHDELSTSEAVRERIEGVSRSLPYSDMLTLTSSHVFISVMA